MFSKVVVLALAVSAACAQGDVQAPGSFQSPGYPNGYANNINVAWNIQGADGNDKGLEFNSEHFDLESGTYDTLVLSESVNGANRVIGTFSGTSGPNKVRSVGNTVRAVFRTDSSVTKTGFKVSIKVPLCRAGTQSCRGAEETCITSQQYCDGKQDCPNNADEANCPAPGSCGRQAIQPDVRAFRQLIAGLSKKDGKIVGGTEANPHSWPWQIALLSSSLSQICGGSVLNKDWIMTAAHCCVAYSPSPSSYRVRVGAHDLSGSADNDQIFEIEQLIVHPNYVPRPVPVNDFCLLKLKGSVAHNAHISPVCLPHSGHGPAGTKCWVTGWGSTGRGDFDAFIRETKAAEAGIVPKPIQAPTSRAGDALRQVDVVVTPQEECNRAYNGQISDDMICAASPGKDSCQGDSGGPFVCEHDGEYKLVGVVSWGRGCAQAGYPGVYARTSHVLDWVNGYIFS